LKSKKKAFTASKRSTNRSGLKTIFQTPFFTRIELPQLSKALISLWIFLINQVDEDAKYPLDSFENGLAQELLLQQRIGGKVGEKGDDCIRVGSCDVFWCPICPCIRSGY